MSANNNNNKSSKKQKLNAPISPIPKENAPIYLEVPTSILEKKKDCKKSCEWCACRKGSLDIRKRKTKVQVIRIVGWFGRGSVAQKQDGSKDANKSLRVNCLLKTLKGKVYYDTHNHWVTLDNHAEDRNFANYIAEFSAFAREKGFLDCLAFEDYESKEWTIHPLDLERKQKKATPEDLGHKKKKQVETIDLEDLDLFTAEPAQEEDPQFIYNGESGSDSDPKMEDDQSEESEKEYDEKAFRAELEKTEPIDASSDDESDEGKNCANTLGQFRQEAQTAFAFTQNPPQEEAEDAFDDKTTEITDPTELVEDSIVEKTTDPVDTTLEKTVIVEHSVSDIHTELANVLASTLDDKPEEKKKEEEDLDFLLDFDFRNPPQEAQKVTEVEEPIAQQAPIEDKPEETTPKEVQPEESKPDEPKPEESKPEEPTPMEVEPVKHTEPADDVQEAPAEAPTTVIETPTVEATVTETILVPAAPEQQNTPQKMTLRKRKQPEKKEEKKVVSRSSQRKNKAK